MNYHVEIFLYWIVVLALFAGFCIAGKELTQKYAPQTWLTDYVENRRLDYGIEENINTSWFIIFVILFFTSMLPVYPTYFSSVPTVQITAEGDIIPISYPIWQWDIPDKSMYTRLTETTSCIIDLQGRTEDGLYIGWFLNSTAKFKIANYVDFYHHYKTGGMSGFCEDVEAIITNEAWLGKTILPNARKNIEAADQKIPALQQRLAAKLTTELPVKVSVVVSIIE